MIIVLSVIAVVLVAVVAGVAFAVHARRRVDSPGTGASDVSDVPSSARDSARRTGASAGSEPAGSESSLTTVSVSSSRPEPPAQPEPPISRAPEIKGSLRDEPSGIQPESREPAPSAPAPSEPDGSASSGSASDGSQDAPGSRPVAAERPESSASRWTRLRARLASSSNPIGRTLFSILTRDNLSEEDWEDVEDTLLMADVGAEATETLVRGLRSDARVVGASDSAQVRDALRTRLLEVVGEDTDRRLNAVKPDATSPSVIIMVGVNGTGKTTTAGKLARLLVAEGRTVMMAAADTFRAAAADQLQTWGAKVGVPVVRSDRDGADPASVAFDAAGKALDNGTDVLIVDTAGRLQNKANLMDELGKIRRVIEKRVPVAEVLLVLDATTGQNGLTQARVFAEAIGVTGVVLTKLDGSAKGGIVVSVQNELHVPVKLVGLGEGPDDLAVFNPLGFVDGLLA